MRIKTSVQGGAERDRRGSAVILVVIALVLMVLIGAAYMQTVRVQRFPMSEPRGDMDAQIRAIIAQIRQELRQDLLHDDDGRFELYDYPWTNTEDQEDNEWTVYGYDGDPAGTALGGYQDDAWLASQQPRFDLTDPIWPHLTNLRGLYLGYNREDNEFILDGGTGLPREDVLDHNGAGERTNINLPFENDSTDPLANLLVDATGDGIPDSRWTWAPITTIDGIDYVMAVRIVDLSGMVNANVALSQVDAGGNFDTTLEGVDAPRWAFPSELDLGGFVFDTSEGGNQAGHMDDLGRLLDRRFGADPGTMPLRVPWQDAPQTRFDFWHDFGRFTGTSDDAVDTYERYGLPSEYELRRRGGLSKHPDDGGETATIEHATQGMPAFLRADPAQTEARWDEVDLSIYGGTTGDMEQFFLLEPRHQMTTRSGAAIFSWPMLGEEFGEPAPGALGADGTHLLVDINEADGDALHDRIREVYNEGAAPSVPGGLTVDEFAAQLAANIVGYRTPGNEPQTVDGRYSLEALPAISEVYAQARYEYSDQSGQPGDVEDLGGDDYRITWERVGNAGYAIEVRNPFRRPISLENVMLWIDTNPGTDFDDDYELWGELATLAAGAGLSQEDLSGDGVDEPILRPDEVLVLYRHSNSNNDSANDAIANHANGLVEEDPDFDYFYANLSAAWPNLDDGTSDVGFNGELVRVELRTAAPSLAYSAAHSGSAPDSYSEIVSNPDPVPTAGSAYWQRGSIGSGQMLNALLLSPVAYASPEFQPNWSANQNTNQPRNANDYTMLGAADKTALGPAVLPIEPEESAQLIVRDGPFVHVGELALLSVLGLQSDETIAETFADGGGDLEDFMLDFDPSTAALIDAENYHVPHAVFLIGQFTTLSPREDGVDNFGQDDPSRNNIVPGLVNLNTMPGHLLAKVLPIPDFDLRQEVARRIVLYRDGIDPDEPTASITEARAALLGGDPGDYRAAPGIAHMGELFMLFNDLLTTDELGDPAYEDDVTWINGTRVDFLANPAADEADGIVNDREEAMMIAKWLSQVGSTRSDYFAAYVLVRGYRGGWTGSDVVEAARFIAIFERNAREGEVEVRALLPGGRPYLVN